MKLVTQLSFVIICHPEETLEKISLFEATEIYAVAQGRENQ